MDCTLLANPLVCGLVAISMYFCQLIGSTFFFFRPSFYCKTARDKQHANMKITEKICLHIERAKLQNWIFLSLCCNFFDSLT